MARAMACVPCQAIPASASAFDRAPRQDRNRVRARHRGPERRRVGDSQVGLDDAGGRGRQVPRVPDHGGDVVTRGDRLLEDLAPDAAGGRENGDLHLRCLLRCSPG